MTFVTILCTRLVALHLGAYCREPEADHEISMVRFSAGYTDSAFVAQAKTESAWNALRGVDGCFLMPRHRAAICVRLTDVPDSYLGELSLAASALDRIP